MGSAAGTVQLILMSDPLEPEALLSTASHSDAVIQIDYTWPSDVFVSVGADFAVKFWSSTLALLREVIFPQSLTCVAFQRRQDMDTAKGHGNVLLGFASHVEQMSFEFWSRGLPSDLVGTAQNRASVGAMSAMEREGSILDGRRSTMSMSRPSRRGTLPKRLEHSSDINDHVAYLHAADPQAAKEYLAEHSITKGSSSALAKKAVDLVSEARPMTAEEVAVRERMRNGHVYDFRGPPVIEVGILSGRPTDWAALDVLGRPSHEPTVEHQHSDVLDCSDFQAIVRCDAGYYDWSVYPDAVVDGPRDRAIRGATGPGDVALVTSIGIGHLRPREECDAAQVPPSAMEALGAEVASPPASPSGARRSPRAPKKPRPESLGPRRPFARPQEKMLQPQQRAAALAAEAPTSPEAADRMAAMAEEEAVDPGSPSTRNRHESMSRSPSRAAQGALLSRSQPGSRPCSKEGLREGSKDLLGDPGPSASRVASREGGPAALSETAQRLLAAPKEASAPSQAPATARNSVSGGGMGPEVEDAQELAGSDCERAFRSGFNQRIGRGVPRFENEPKPRMQNVANTEEDTARQLTERGTLTELRDAPEDNFLKNITKTKSEWTYCPPYSTAMAQRSRTIKDNLKAKSRCVSTWTPAGRLFNGEDQPPRYAVPPEAAPPLPQHFKVRAPMTRAEVTEQRIIQSAACPPPRPPDIALTSREASERDRRQHFARQLTGNLQAVKGRSSRISRISQTSSNPEELLRDVLAGKDNG